MLYQKNIGKFSPKRFLKITSMLKFVCEATALLRVIIVPRTLVLTVTGFLARSHLNMASLGTQKLCLVDKGSEAT
jgi:hypothetical protein